MRARDPAVGRELMARVSASAAPGSLGSRGLSTQAGPGAARRERPGTGRPGSRGFDDDGLDATWTGSQAHRH